MLSEGEVHVWRFDLNVSDLVLRNFAERFLRTNSRALIAFDFPISAGALSWGVAFCGQFLPTTFPLSPQRVLVFIQRSRETFLARAALQYRVQCLALP